MAANNSLVTSFSTSPYYDDYNEDKNFHRILYKPGLAVQARELTQGQTILQKQIDSFAENIFKEGSLTIGGQFAFNGELDYIKLKDTNPANSTISVNNFLGKEIVGANTGIKAIVLKVADGISASANTKTLFIKYTSSGANNTSKVFLKNENITANGYVATIINANTATGGKGYLFSISEGKIFAKDHFIKFPKQELILSRYTNTPSAKVGFNITEQIVDYTQDYTLTDPAQGSYNYSAPGADRLKITANLTSYSLTANTGINFVELFQIKDGVIQKKTERSQYSIIQDEWAKRTYDESGDYYVNGLNIRVREHLNTNNNDGYLTLGNGGDSTKLAVGVEPGKAYVRGYEIEKLVTEYVAVKKGIDYKTLSQQSIGINYGSYVFVNELVGSWDVNTGTVIGLYNTAQVRISGRKWSTTSQTGTLLGTARFKALEYYSGTIGTASAVYKVYLYDVQMTAGDFISVRNIYFDNASTADIGADLVLESGNAVIKETSFGSSIYPVPTNFMRSLRDSGGNIDNTMKVVKSYPVTIATNGTFTLSTGLADEIFPYGIGSLNDTQKRKFAVQFNAAASVTMAGTATTSSGTGTVTGSGTAFSNLNIGDKVEFAGVSGTYFVATITNNTAMTITPNAASTGTGVAYTRVYHSGDNVDMTIKGATGVTRTVTVASTTSASFDTKETYASTVSATVTSVISKTDFKEIKKTIRRNRLVIIDVAPGTVNGPWNLGFSDVYRINSIRLKDASTFTTTSEGTDVTSSFALDNGQRDNHYDHAKLVNLGTALAATNYLLVNLDYFVHDYSQGAGYFSINSYPIDDVNGSANTNAITTEQIPVYKSPTSGKIYDLRNVIDTRPSKEITANDVTVIAGISTNPATGTTFNVPSGGLKVTAPNETFITDYSYYLGRKDLIVMNSQGVISTVTGTPGLLAITPDTPADSFALAALDIAPYPSLSPFYASSINRLELSNQVNKMADRRFTMKDIGVLKNRIDNLEYYTSLSLLEKDASDLKILDSAGLDRFKNGIFVDPFTSHAFGDTGNPDYRIAVDPGSTLIRPIFELNNVQLEYGSGTNVTNANNYVVMNYTEKTLVKQDKASTTRNLAGLYYKFVGELILDPSDDFWINTVRNPDVQVNLGSNASSTALLNSSVSQFSVQWNSWQTLSSGVPARTSQGDVSRTSGALGSGALNNNTRIRSTALTPASTTSTTTNVVATSGSRLNVSTETVTESSGTRLVDVSVIPFIRPQSIKCRAVGLKANTKLYVYFDGEDMTTYSTPTNSTFIVTGAEGANIISDSTGNVYFLLRIPSTTKQFRIGTKEVRVSDSPTNASDATTAASTQFVAQGLVQQKNNTVVSTTPPRVSPPTVIPTTTTRRNMPINLALGGGDGKQDPLTYTFSIDLPVNTPGCFVTSVNLFFQSKDPVHGVKIELRELDNASQITNKIVPYSESIVSSANINTSLDGTTATKVWFNSPVYLVNNTQYGICIKPMGNNPNTAVWTAVIGQKEIGTNNRISEQPYSGVLYASSNDNVYTPIQDEDLKFELFRAAFDTANIGTVNLRNTPSERFLVTSFTGTQFRVGETVAGSRRISVNSWTGGTPANTDIVTDNTTGATGVITGYTSGTSIILNDVTTTAKFAAGSTVSLATSLGVPRGITGVIIDDVGGEAVLSKVDLLTNGNYIVTLRNSNGDFSTAGTEQVIFQSSGIKGTATTYYPIKYSTLDLESSFLNFDGCALNWSTKTTSNTNIISSTFDSVNINDNTTFNSERVVLSRMIEKSTLSSAYTLQPQISIQTTNEYVSPAIDLARTHAILVQNIVNNDFTNEDTKSGGNLINKYISGKITLNEGQDAEDLQVYITAYKPPDATIKLYAKLLHGEDSDTFTDRPWIELTLNSKDVYSNSEATNDFKEYTYGIPAAYLIGAGGAVRYTNSASINFTGYRYFAIKIALGTTTSSSIPKVSDLRVIALQI